MMIEKVIDNTQEKPVEKLSDVQLITKKFKTSTQFSQHIEKIAFRTDSSCIDVLVDYCEKENIEIESVKKLLNASLKEKIKQEALDLNLLKEKRKNKLPI
jgi:hypothetical protein